jgi:CheY-like chemotaxis protein
MADVLVLVDDLFFLSKLNETARHVGVTLQTVPTGDALVQAASSSTPKLVLVDLNARQGALDAVERLGKTPQSGAPPVIAFLSHVQTELAEKARAAGCQQVLPRSKFTADLAQILQQAKT